SYAGKAVYVEYKGAYDKTYTAYMDLEAYVKEYNLTEAGGPWEVYITDPGTEPDTSKWITGIYFPVK
ncbi:MAG: Transcriptional regulator, effector-binding domain/component, partial [candidate division CPR3 bacterium GW2011_GWE2_35_7]